MTGQIKKLIDAFNEHGLMLVASAISFQVITAVVPLLLFVLGLLGFFDLTDLWTRDVKPDLAPQVSPAAMTIIDDTITKVLTGKQLFWVTGGAALAIWQLSGAVRAAMDALNRVYGAEEDRPWPARFRTSILIAAGDTALLLAAIAVVVLVPLVDGSPPTAIGALLLIARWGTAALLVAAAVGLLVHQGPDFEQRLGWTSVGTGLVVVSWITASALFLLYVTQLASYGSVFGNLATIVVLSGYLYLSAIVFLFGIQLDAQLREAAS